MKNKLICKDCKQDFQVGEYHEPSRRCNLCRSIHRQERKKALKGIALAEDLLLSSCQRVLGRVRGEDKVAYRGVKCSWEVPNEMKRDLMANSAFWEAWKKQSSVFEKMDRLLEYRPTIDRIESRVEKDGHYYLENIKVLTYSENAAKAKSIKCLVIFFKNKRVVQITDYESMAEVMKDLKIVSPNVRHILRDSGKIREIGKGFSVLVQTVGGNLKKVEEPMYKMVVEKITLIVDRKTGKEHVWKRQQTSYLSYGIWFNDTSMIFR